MKADLPEIDDELRAKLWGYCLESAEHIQSQLLRLIDHLRRRGLYDEALIVIAGDLGEEFLGRGFLGHNTLYDANIRPEMIIKPPSGREITVRDEVDLIDTYPMISRLVTGEVPPQCPGTSLQAARDGYEARLTERLTSRWYSVAVEQGEIKENFTYEWNYPGMPTEQQVSEGPLLEEYYLLSRVRAGDYYDRRENIPEYKRQEFKCLAEELALRQTLSSQTGEIIVRHRETTDVREHFRDMGYPE